MTSTVILSSVLFGATNALLLAPADVAAKLADVTVVDVRPVEDFRTGHIPGARHVDVASLSETRDGVRGLLKPVDQVTAVLAAAGVGRDRPVVVCGSMKSGSELTAMTRMFWILELLAYENVAIMDGGIEKWVADSIPLEKGDPKAEPIEDLKVLYRPELLATKSQVAGSIGKDIVLLDNRSAEQYTGKSKDDYIGMAGHIPGARNLPASQCVAENKTLKTWEELQALMQGAGVSSDKPLITYCNTGRSASVGYFVARLLGHERVAMYDGSMSEWGSDPASKVETTPDE